MTKFEEIITEKLDVKYDSETDRVTFETDGVPLTIPDVDLYQVATLLSRLDICDAYGILYDDLTEEQKAKAAVLCHDREELDEYDLYECAEKARELV